MKSKKNALDFYFYKNKSIFLNIVYSKKQYLCSLASFHILSIFSYAKKHI